MIGPFSIDVAVAADAKRSDAQRARQEKADNDLRFVMSDARGRRVLWALLEDAGVYRSTFNTDALAMAHSEGKRDTGLRLLDRLLRVTPGEYLKAQEENISGNS